MPKTVLIVDDSAAARYLTAMVLKVDGYNILEAMDGLDALAKLDGQPIHLIISDIDMPNMDGISFVGEVQKLADYKLTPVIMATSESQESITRDCLIAGVADWIDKPFQPAQLRALVSKLILA